MIFYVIAALIAGWAVYYLVRSIKKKDCGCGRSDCAYKDQCSGCKENKIP